MYHQTTGSPLSSHAALISPHSAAGNKYTPRFTNSLDEPPMINNECPVPGHVWPLLSLWQQLGQCWWTLSRFVAAAGDCWCVRVPGPVSVTMSAVSGTSIGYQVAPPSGHWCPDRAGNLLELQFYVPVPLVTKTDLGRVNVDVSSVIMARRNDEFLFANMAREFWVATHKTISGTSHNNWTLAPSLAQAWWNTLSHVFQ